MKKEEAMQLAPARANLLCEYIEQILSDTDKVTGEIRIDAAKINNEKMITFSISVPSKNFERNFNTGITVQQINVLTGQILSDLIANFLESENIALSKYYSIRGGYGMNMDGINVVNSIKSKIKINFVYYGDSFFTQIKDYNAKLDEYAKQQNTDMEVKPRL